MGKLTTEYPEIAGVRLPAGTIRKINNLRGGYNKCEWCRLVILSEIARHERIK